MLQVGDGPVHAVVAFAKAKIRVKMLARPKVTHGGVAHLTRCSMARIG